MSSLSTFSSRTLNQDVGRVKRAADKGPVVITDRGQPAYVLLTHDEWKRLQSPQRSLLDLLAMPEGDDIEFDPPRLGDITRAPDLG